MIRRRSRRSAAGRGFGDLQRPAAVYDLNCIQARRLAFSVFSSKVLPVGVVAQTIIVFFMWLWRRFILESCEIPTRSALALDLLVELQSRVGVATARSVNDNPFLPVETGRRSRRFFQFLGQRC